MVNAPYVDHHRFDGVAVMPFAAILQMMSEVPAAFGFEKPVISLEDVRLFRGLTLRDGPTDIPPSRTGGSDPPQAETPNSRQLEFWIGTMSGAAGTHRRRRSGYAT